MEQGKQITVSSCERCAILIIIMLACEKYLPISYFMISSSNLYLLLTTSGSEKLLIIALIFKNNSNYRGEGPSIIFKGLHNMILYFFFPSLCILLSFNAVVQTTLYHSGPTHQAYEWHLFTQDKLISFSLLVNMLDILNYANPRE